MRICSKCKKEKELKCFNKDGKDKYSYTCRLCTREIQSTPLYRIKKNWSKLKRSGKLCDKWNDSFELFFNWSIKNGYKKGVYLVSIEPIHSESTSKYISSSEMATIRQTGKKRKGKWIEKDGETTHKQCSTCLEFIVLSNFHSVKGKNTANVSHECKSCNSLRMKLQRGTDRGNLYDKWHGIIERCTKSRHKSYNDYGGRGIEVCDEWLNDFELFYKWAINHNTYKHGLQIDRINNNGNYEPINCRFVTASENMRNTRSTKLSIEKASIIRHLKSTGFKAESIAITFGIHPNTVRNMCNENLISYRRWRTEKWLKENPLK